MRKKSRFLGMASLCIMLVLATASLTAFASDLHVIGDRNGDHAVSDDELAREYQDHKNGTINSDEILQIELMHDRYPIEVTDSAGNIVTIHKPLKRIVVLNGLVTEIMQILNATDVIIGMTMDLEKEPLISPALKSLPTTGKVVEPDLEAILRLNPDAVIHYASTMWHTDEIQRKLQKVDPGLIVIRLDMFHPESHLVEVENLAKILDKEAEARDYIDFYKEVMGEIQRATGDLSEEDKPRVYFEERSDFQTGSSESYFSQDTAIAGGRNVFAESATLYPVVDQESVMMENPDVIIRTYSNSSSGGYANDDTSMMEELRESIINRHGSKNITAVKNNRVYILNANLIGGARHIIGISYLAKILHPDLLADFDPEEVHQRYLDFVGFDYDLKEHRAFVVPKI
ncbi:MAG: Cobalamin-binding protein precursor [Methanosaeta sp. PtaB.Bin039]|nr:MAG: Cobalamin-binding protein precursor [Methanosaeta sp. PtaB.Bin039]HOT07409.1 ABC transporter substrate-binding protein [Methanotrichaceae archaeon]HQF15893.1 ABC transporter substrate-binding protein [Methanotrichaceae archaeon]HQI90431.1 ABC transporter substrate-binding protein [Methanotrichaceae archaeon]